MKSAAAFAAAVLLVTGSVSPGFAVKAAENIYYGYDCDGIPYIDDDVPPKGTLLAQTKADPDRVQPGKYYIEKHFLDDGRLLVICPEYEYRMICIDEIYELPKTHWFGKEKLAWITDLETGEHDSICLRSAVLFEIPPCGSAASS
ncbi:MAG: hypothetical protein HUJ54_10065 [Erysipelotrichaceae bacterium]|nr:hypothetical protein [Erysipelotrichaceae bacterium]